MRHFLASLRRSHGKLDMVNEAIREGHAARQAEITGLRELSVEERAVAVMSEKGKRSEEEIRQIFAVPEHATPIREGNRRVILFTAIGMVIGLVLGGTVIGLVMSGSGAAPAQAMVQSQWKNPAMERFYLGLAKENGEAAIQHCRSPEGGRVMVQDRLGNPRAACVLWLPTEK